MPKPDLSEFDPPEGLTAGALVQQVLEHGFVIFDTSRPHARDLAQAVNDILLLHGRSVNHLTASPDWPLHYLLEVDGRYEFMEFHKWVEEFCAERWAEFEAQNQD